MWVWKRVSQNAWDQQRRGCSRTRSPRREFPKRCRRWCRRRPKGRRTRTHGLHPASRHRSVPRNETWAFAPRERWRKADPGHVVCHGFGHPCGTLSGREALSEDWSCQGSLQAGAPADGSRHTLVDGRRGAAVPAPGECGPMTPTERSPRTGVAHRWLAENG